MDSTTPSLVDTFARIRVVLVEPTYNGNLGQVARAMRNFGLLQLSLVGGKADPDSDEARWYARDEGQCILDGARRWASLPEALADCRTVIGTSRRLGGGRGPAVDPEPLFRNIRPWRLPWETALVFGREAHGLWTEELDLCQHLLTIPSDPGCPSLNLSHAVSLVGFVLSQTARADLANELPPPVEDPAASPPAGHDLLEAMFNQAKRVWVRIGYFNTPNPDTKLRRWRKIFNRAQLSESDVRVIRSMLHQTDWVASKAGLPPGGAKDLPSGFFDKHAIRLAPGPDEPPPPRPDGRKGSPNGTAPPPDSQDI